MTFLWILAAAAPSAGVSSREGAPAGVDSFRLVPIVCPADTIRVWRVGPRESSQWCERFDELGIRVGSFEERDANGQLISKGFYGLDGERARETVYNPRGQLVADLRYIEKEDGCVGTKFSYFPDGRRESRKEFLVGRREREIRWDVFGQRRVSGKHRDGRRQGTWTVWNQGGQKILQAQYDGGRPVGIRREWWRNGQLRSEYDGEKLFRTYDHLGRIEGTSPESCPPGTRRVEQGVERGCAKPDGTRHGWWRTTFEDGRYFNGVRHGRWTRFNSEGDLEAEEEYWLGKPDGHWTTYYPKRPDGSVWKARYGEELLLTFLERSLIPDRNREEGDYEDGLKHNLWSQWDEQGRLRERGVYVRGEKHGWWEITCADGSGRLEEFRRGKRDGHSVDFNPDGSVKVAGDNSNDRRHGVWTFDGALDKRIQYEEGRMMRVEPANLSRPSQEIGGLEWQRTPAYPERASVAKGAPVDRSVFEQVIRDNRGSIRDCLSGQGSDSTHRLLVEWRITSDGLVGAAKIEMPAAALDSWSDGRLARCVLGQVRGWHFPQSGGTFEVRLPLVLSTELY